MKLIIQPEHGLGTLVQAVKRATRTIDLVIFRFDRDVLEKALASAVQRGVTVRALIAHTNNGGEKLLRKLEQRMLEAGVTVARSADDLPRYHGKVTIIDDTLYVLGFNYTRQDIERSRSFGIVTRNTRLVKEATALFEADRTRQLFTPAHPHLVVSPENSRDQLTTFIAAARKELLIYDERITDKILLRVINERIAAGVTVRVIGKPARLIKAARHFDARKLADLRLHVRAIIRDGRSFFVGSQSLCKLELDGRREIGVIVNDVRIAKQAKTVFEADWALAAPRDEKKKDDRKEGAESATAEKGAARAASLSAAAG